MTTYTPSGAPTTPTITGLDGPFGVAVDANGKIYVTNFFGNTLTTYTANGVPTTPTITRRPASKASRCTRALQKGRYVYETTALLLSRSEIWRR